MTDRSGDSLVSLTAATAVETLSFIGEGFFLASVMLQFCGYKTAAQLLVSSSNG